MRKTIPTKWLVAKYGEEATQALIDELAALSGKPKPTLPKSERYIHLYAGYKGVTVEQLRARRAALAKRRQEVYDRRKAIPQMLAAGLTQQQIADHFGVRPSTINSDIVLIKTNMAYYGDVSSLHLTLQERKAKIRAYNERERENWGDMDSELRAALEELKQVYPQPLVRTR